MRPLLFLSVLTIVILGAACAGPETARENVPQERTDQEITPEKNPTSPTPARIDRDLSAPRTHHLRTIPFGAP
uniref:Uncharacterized protein n=1 Tax=Candidatus Kentrum sp. TC TaxID=2126339 RepID=A0A450Z1E2_9GAMM|nr:MAG: hypothetical protein BECKTC1821E_GA0114239_10886 [Candidatus Kentron sp. TC]